MDVRKGGMWLGLLLGFVLGLSLGLTILGVVLAAQGTLLPVSRSAFGALAPKIAPAGSDSAAIASHPFWKVKVTPTQVDALVERIRAEKSGTIVFVDDRFQIEMVRSTGDATTRAVIEGRGGHKWMKSDTLGKRFISLDLFTEFSSQPTADRVRASISSSIRVRDFKD